MEIIVQGVLAVMGFAIYGTEDKPRHPIWRTFFRTAVIGGGLYGLATQALLLPSVNLSNWIVGLWILCWWLLIEAEFHIGLKSICYFAVAIGFVLLVMVLT